MAQCVAERRENVSQVWGWLGSNEIARRDAARLFEEAELAVVPRRFEHTADEINALLGRADVGRSLSTTH